MDAGGLGTALQSTTDQGTVMAAFLESQAHKISVPIMAMGESFAAEICFAADYPYFEGHFDTLKLVPGVCQLEIVELIAKEILAKPIRIKGMSRVKFKAPILPETKLIFQVDVDKQGNIKWRATQGEKIFSEGILHYAE